MDAQFLELRKFQILEICRVFRVPPSMIYDLDRATWSNGEQQGKEFLTYCLEPWLRALEVLFAGRFSQRKSVRNTPSASIAMTSLVPTSPRAPRPFPLVSARVLNANEGRSWLDLPPYAGGEVFASEHGQQSAGHVDGATSLQRRGQHDHDRHRISRHG